MKLLTLLPTAAFLLTVHALNAQSNTSESAELFRQLRKQPGQSLELNGERVQVVNARFEPCAHKKEARYLRVLTPTPQGGYDARITTPDGRMLMRGSYADANGAVPHGNFIYYDEFGTVRATGEYSQGIKTGIWERYDERGDVMPPKQYDGLDWDSKQVLVGVASLSPTLDQSVAVK